MPNNSNTDRFEFPARVGTSRQKMLVVAVGMIPFLLGFHYETTPANSGMSGSFKIFATDLKIEHMDKVIFMLALVLIVFSATFFLRLLESHSRLNKGLNGLEAEVREVNNSIRALKEFKQEFPKFQSHIRSQLTREEIDKLKEDDFFKKAAASAELATIKIRNLRAEIKGKDQTGYVSSDIKFLSDIQKLDNEDFRSCISYFGRVPDRYESHVEVWENSLKQWDSFTAQANIAFKNISVLENSQNFKKNQYWATKFRWEWIEGWLPLLFSITIIIWAFIKVFS